MPCSLKEEGWGVYGGEWQLQAVAGSCRGKRAVCNISEIGREGTSSHEA